MRGSVFGITQSKGRSPQVILRAVVLCSLLLLPYGCRSSPPDTAQESEEEANTENRLIIQNAILEQSDEEGQLLWKLQTEEAIYSQDRKTAEVTGVIGNFYEDGEVILSLQADRGKVINDGEQIFLEDEILVTDNRSGFVLNTDLAEWQPGNYLLKIDAEVEGKYPNGKFVANKGQYLIDSAELELSEEVEAFTVEPALQVEGELIVWQFEDEVITAEDGLAVQQYTEEEITARVKAKQGEVRLQDQEITLSENVLFNNLDPEAQFASGEAVWQIEKGLILGKQSVQITHVEDQVQFKSSEGQFDLNTQQATLLGGVRGVGEDPPTTLQASRVDWNLETQNVTAQGNVLYEQVDPRITLTGNRAVGQLNQNKIVVSGTAQKPVTTKVIP